MDPLLTILLTDVVERDPLYMDLYFRALREWNTDGLAEVQVIVIAQNPDPGRMREIVSRQSLTIEILYPDQDVVEGYPIWDILADTRRAWPMIKGRYVTWNHPEYIWGGDRLTRTIQWLKSARPYLALGNLRRPGTYKEIKAQKTADHCNVQLSELLRSKMMDGAENFAVAKSMIESGSDCWWMFWSPEQKPGRAGFIEDVMFADREWLETWEFTAHGGELPFQDVYDLMRISITSILSKYGAAVDCLRADLRTNKMMHLWHPKEWASWRPAIREYFFRDPERWKGTRFLDPEIWDRLISYNGKMPKDHAAVNNLRNSPGGTVTRYGVDLSQWLSAGGGERMRAFYAANGRERRE